MRCLVLAYLPSQRLSAICGQHGLPLGTAGRNGEDRIDYQEFNDVVEQDVLCRKVRPANIERSGDALIGR